MKGGVVMAQEVLLSDRDMKTSQGLWWYLAKKSGMTDEEAEDFRQQQKRDWDMFMEMLR